MKNNKYFLLIIILLFIILSLDVYYFIVLKCEGSFLKNATYLDDEFYITSIVNESDNLKCDDNHCDFISNNKNKYVIEYTEDGLFVNDNLISNESLCYFYKIFIFKDYLIIIQKYYDGNAIMYIYDNTLNLIKNINCFIDTNYNLDIEDNYINIYDKENNKLYKYQIKINNNKVIIKEIN